MTSNVVNTWNEESSQTQGVKYSNFTDNSSMETLIILNFLAGVMVKHLLSFLVSCMFTQTMLSL